MSLWFNNVMDRFLFSRYLVLINELPLTILILLLLSRMGLVVPFTWMISFYTWLARPCGLQFAIIRLAEGTDSHGFRFSVKKYHAVLFRCIWILFPEPSLTLYGRPRSVVCEFRFLGMIFDERLTWAPHLRSLRFACQSSLDLLRHLSHTILGADRTTLLRLYLVLECSCLLYCFPSYPFWAMVHFVLPL